MVALAQVNGTERPHLASNGGDWRHEVCGMDVDARDRRHRDVRRGLVSGATDVPQGWTTMDHFWGLCDAKDAMESGNER